MPTSDLTALRLRVAEIMEPIPPSGFHAAIDGTSPEGWWLFELANAHWVPIRSLDGANPDADAVACHRMKARLIEWHEAFYCYYAPDAINPWIFIFGLGSETSAPLEVQAVALALVAVAEQRGKEGK